MYVRYFTQPLSQFAQVATSLQSTSAAARRVFDFLKEEEMADESDKAKYLENVKGDVSFEHVIPFHQVINALRVEKMFNMEGAVCNT